MRCRRGKGTDQQTKSEPIMFARRTVNVWHVGPKPLKLIAHVLIINKPKRPHPDANRVATRDVLKLFILFDLQIVDAGEFVEAHKKFLLKRGMSRRRSARW